MYSAISHELELPVTDDEVAALDARDLPVYTILVPLYREAAVVHNFFWHERWTWADRTEGQPGVVRRFVRFNLSTGAASIFGNVMFMAVYVDGLGVHPLLANALAVASTAAVNFLVADRWVFSSKGGHEGTKRLRCEM